MMNERMRTYTPIVLNSADVSEIARDLMILVSQIPTTADPPKQR
jgi:hypothetical protein